MSRPVALVTGGAGFVGTNLADRLATDGYRVRVLDSLVRPGVERNLRWLRGRHPERVEAVRADVRDAAALRFALAGADEVFHFAAQVAVTASLADPRADYEVNLGGTITLLEELRRLPAPPPLLFTSTNKVYGPLTDLALERAGDRWQPAGRRLRERGLDESRPLSFCTPYGCSKGAADQYVLDYAASYGLPAAVFRMSCVYGRHQHGTEDQGWLAHFALRALAGEPLTLYGDGAQVRDVLWVDDLVAALVLARERIGDVAGTAFNVGGGPEHAVSLLEAVELLGDLLGEPPRVEHAPERAGDQRWYVSDTTRLTDATGWRPTVGVAEGLGELLAWLAPHAAAHRSAGLGAAAR